MDDGRQMKTEFTAMIWMMYLTSDPPWTDRQTDRQMKERGKKEREEDRKREREREKIKKQRVE